MPFALYLSRGGEQALTSSLIAIDVLLGNTRRSDVMCFWGEAQGGGRHSVSDSRQRKARLCSDGATSDRNVFVPPLNGSTRCR